MRSVAGGILMAAALVASTGCRTPLRAGADYDPSVVIGQPATFAWNEPDGLPTGDPRLDNNPFFVARLHGAVARELAARGVSMAVAERKPSLFVHHHASVHDEVEVYPSEQTQALSPYGPGTQVYNYEEGNFLVDVMDAGTAKVVWRGWAKIDLTGVIDDPEALDEMMSDVVARMFEFFPIPAGTLPADEEPPMIEPVPDIERMPPPPDVAGVRPLPEAGR